MAHPSRLAGAERLRERYPELNLSVVLDPAPDADPSPLRTARLAWQAVTPDATHHLVLQDDAAPCASFLAHLSGAIRAMPREAICLFTEWGSETSYVVRLAAMLGLAWAEVVDHYIPSLALVLPAELARAFGREREPAMAQDDVMLRDFLSAAGVGACVTVPNLVDHLPLPSLTGNDYMGARRSVCFLTAEMRDVAWSTEPLTLRAVPYLSWTTGRPTCVVREDESGYRWRRRPLRWLMREYGIDTEKAAGLGWAAIGSLLPRARDVDPRLLFGLWVVAYGLGVSFADLVGTDSAQLELALVRPDVRQSLLTMPAGALKLFVDDGRLAQLRGDLYDLILGGVRQGHQALRELRCGG